MRKNDKDKEMDIIGSKREGITEMERKREMDDGGAEEMKMGRKREGGGERVKESRGDRERSMSEGERGKERSSEEAAVARW